MKLSENRILSAILKFSKPYKLSFMNLFLCVVVTSFSGMLYPYIFGKLVDEVFYGRNVRYFVFIVISYGMLFLGEQVLHLILNTTWAYLMTRFLFDIRKKMYDHILALKAQFLSNMRTGDLMASINSDAEEFMNFIHWNIFYLSTNIMRLSLCIIFVAVYSLKLAVLMAVTVPLSVYTSRFFAGMVRKRVEAYRRDYGAHISWALEIIKGMREVVLLAAGRHILGRFSRRSAELIRLKIAGNTLEVYAERANAFISLLSTLALYAVGGMLVARGEITVGIFVASVEYFSRGIALLKGLNDANMKIQQNMVAINRVMEILKQLPEEDEQKKRLTVTQGGIRFTDVSFKYTDGSQVLDKVNLAVRPGEKVALVGRSGAGKSTLVNLLLGLYKQDEGEIRIDETNIDTCTVKSVRDQVGIIHQESTLFDGTIRYNLLLAKRSASEEEIWAACDKAHIGDHIRSLPEGLDTALGMGGVGLSGGQRQRLAIARVFLKDPQLLVMDEAMSALDFEAEQAVQRAWKELSCGRTAIIIAHRLSTILDADKVAVLNGGKVVSFGHHSELLDSCSFYRELFEEQYMIKEEVAV